MTNEPRRVTILLPAVGSNVIYTGGEDPVAVMVREAGLELDRQRADDEHKRKAVIADAARLANSRKARSMRRLKRALRAVGIGSTSP